MKRVLWLAVIAIAAYSRSASAVFCPALPIPQDATQQIKNCIKQAADTDKVVFLTSDHAVGASDTLTSYANDYPISSQIIVDGVSIIGSGVLWGSQIDINFGQGFSNTDTANAAFVQRNGAVMDGLTFNYPVQVKGQPLIEFPPTIAVQGSFCRVKNSFFPNSYVGIDATVAHGKLNMENLEFGVYFTAIRDDQCYDIDKIFVIHGNPGMFATWVDDSVMVNWMHQNSTFIQAGRIDWLWIKFAFAWGPKFGLNLVSSQYGATGDAQIETFGCDACQYGVYSNIQSGSVPWLISISHAALTAFDPTTGGGSGTGIYLYGVHGVSLDSPNCWGIRNSCVQFKNVDSFGINNLKVISGGWNQASAQQASMQGIDSSYSESMANWNAYIKSLFKIPAIEYKAQGWNTSDSGYALIELDNCSNGGVSLAAGDSNKSSSVGIVVNGGNNISLVANTVNVPSAPIVIANGATNIRAVANGGCAQDLSGSSSNRIDNLCGVVSTPTPTPTPTPVPTKNPTDPTPTPTASPTRTPKTGPVNP